MESIGPGRPPYAGLFLVTLATLMFEILLTRIFSVTMYYHFAFVAISMAMFGMTVGALAVYLAPGSFPLQRTRTDLGWVALLFAGSMVASVLVHVFIPLRWELSPIGIASVAFSYVVLSLPFVFSGICVCLVSTRYLPWVGGLYGADLAGASLGCLLVSLILRFTDGATAAVGGSFFACLAAVLFFRGASERRVRIAAALATVLVGYFLAANTYLAANQSSLLRLRWINGVRQERPIHEKWNSFSRIMVVYDPVQARLPFGWGLSSAYKGMSRITQLGLQIDGSAGTVLTNFFGDTTSLDYLTYDVTNFVHYLRPSSRVLVVGAGGGRDLLSALVFRQKSVIGVEINEEIIRTVNDVFGDFTGHLDRYPEVSFINDEARSYIARSQDRFDILQVSLIDTWAATAAGAFVITENSLHTVEAWEIFLKHLSDRGVLSFSRWYFPDNPTEMYRLTSLAAASLLRSGITAPRLHLMIVAQKPDHPHPDYPEGVATLLVSRDPFSSEDVAKAEETAKRLRFEVVLSPTAAKDATFATLAAGTDLAAFTRSYPVNIEPPTDDTPFFFHMLRPAQMFSFDYWRKGAIGTLIFNTRAVGVLGVLFVVVVVLTVACIGVPLALRTRRADLRGSLPLFVFFSAIGIGFMLIEIAQMQRLIIFLGHPSYALSVVLFSLLLSAGSGSFVIGRIDASATELLPAVLLGLLVIIVGMTGACTPAMTRVFESGTTGVRVLCALGLLLPMGFVMGMAFPLGMRLAARRSQRVTPWLWGINGAMSVVASVAAVIIALSWGISTAFWTGMSCYAVAWCAYLWGAGNQSLRLIRKRGM